MTRQKTRTPGPVHGRMRRGRIIRPLSEWKWTKAADAHWNISATLQCNQHCIYCYEGERTGLTDVPLQATKDLLARAAKEVPMVLFLGAEPTLNPNLPELIRYARRLGLIVALSTNALRLADWDYLLTLHKAGLDSIEFSFSYPDEETYSCITQGPPSGFRRLLKAMDNLARWQRTLAREHSGAIFPNIVVNGLNVDRLDEVLGHFKKHLNPGGFILSILRMDIPPELHERSLRHIYVPCSKLRQVLPGLVANAAADVALSFSNFPLCAVPGSEAYHNQLCYWLNDVEVKQNYFDQNQMADLPMDERPKTARHPFDWICETCVVSPLCLCRGLFKRADLVPEHAPQPYLGEIPSPVRAWVRRQKKGPSVLRTPVKPTALGWTLAALLKKVPPHEPLAGSALRWAPIQRGVIRLSDGSREARLRFSRARPTASGGRLRLRPDASRALPAWARPGEAALAVALRRLPAPPPDCLPEPDRRPAAELSVTTGPDYRPEATPPRWGEYVGGPFLQHLRAAARREPALSMGHLEVSRAGILRLRGPGPADGGEIVVRPGMGPKTPGFLCGPLRLQVTWLGTRAGAEAWLRAAHSTCAGIEADASWPASTPRTKGTFLARAWRIFGAALMTRVGSDGRLLGGWVADDGLQLDLLRVQSRPFGILLSPSESMRRPYAGGQGIGLQYTAPEGLPDDKRCMDLIDVFARILTGGVTPDRGLRPNT